MTQPMAGSQRSVIRREILLKKLSTVVTKLSQLDLPATIRAIYTFGGVLREKEYLHDIDVICLYSQTPEQNQRWESFRENFSTYGFHGSQRRPIHELWGLLKPYYRRRLAFARALEHKELSQALAARGIEPQWAACFSWTEIVNNPHGFFIPFIENVLHGLVLKGVRGLSVAFVRYDEFMQGKSGYSHLNAVLTWGPEKPDITSNLFGRTPVERKQFILKELGKFAKAISELKGRHTELKSELVQGPVKLNFKPLEQHHTEIHYSTEWSYSELLTKCEQARNEMRRYEEEFAVLSTIKSAISELAERKERPKLGNPVEEQVAWLTLLRQPKYLVRERRIRELLRILGLPEDKVKTIKSPGSKTDYELIDLRFVA